MRLLGRRLSSGELICAARRRSSPSPPPTAPAGAGSAPRWPSASGSSSSTARSRRAWPTGCGCRSTTRSPTTSRSATRSAAWSRRSRCCPSSPARWSRPGYLAGEDYRRETETADPASTPRGRRRDPRPRRRGDPARPPGRGARAPRRPAERRVAQAMELEGLSRPTPSGCAGSGDRAREAYVRHFYNCDARDPALYHLVIDSTALPDGGRRRSDRGRERGRAGLRRIARGQQRSSLPSCGRRQPTGGKWAVAADRQRRAGPAGMRRRPGRSRLRAEQRADHAARERVEREVEADERG